MTRILTLAVAGILSTAAVWCFAAPSSASRKYAGTADLPVTFHYAKGWRLREEQGTVETYRGVRLLGARNPDDTYTAYVVVRAFPLAASDGGHYSSAHLFVNHTLTHLPSGAVVESQGAREVAGLAAYEVLMSYTIPPLHYAGLHAIQIQVRTRTLVLERPPYLYEVAYSADAREYPRYASTFERLLASLQFH